MDRKLIALAFAHTGDENLPNARGAEAAHGELGRVPAAEVTDHGHAFGVRCPHSKRRAFDYAHVGGVGLEIGAKDIPQALMAALTNEVLVQGSQGGQEVVAIGHLNSGLAWVGNAQAVVGFNRQRRLPDVIAHRIHGEGLRGGVQLDRGSTRLAGTDSTFVPTVETVRVMVAAVIEASEVSGRDSHTIRVPSSSAVRWANVYGR